MMPNFVKSAEYYYDPNTDTIYYIKENTPQFFHEIRHSMDHQSKFYRRLSFNSCKYLQFMSTYGLIFAIFSLKLYGILFIPYGVFRLQEEIRADLYARKVILK